MHELTDEPVYAILEKEYDELLLDYAVLACDEVYRGEQTHRQAVKTAIALFGKRDRVGNCYEPEEFSFDEEKLSGVTVDAESFFDEPDDKWITLPNGARCREIPSDMSYWYAFFEPPYGVPYTKADYARINAALFPMGTDELEIYRWNDEFSDYFLDGREWWGTAFWSIYDRHTNRFVMIGASLTD